MKLLVITDVPHPPLKNEKWLFIGHDILIRFLNISIWSKNENIKNAVRTISKSQVMEKKFKTAQVKT